jgi:hypothetical protein
MRTTMHSMSDALDSFLATAQRIVYWDPVHDVAVAECAATWVPADRRREAWERLAAGEPYVVWQDG